MKIAVVSTDKINVDEHFGKAKSFLIYDASPAGLKLIEERETISLSTGDPTHPFDEERFNKLASVIADCKRVYSTKIGATPAKKLGEMGIEAVVYEGGIEGIKSCLEIC